MLNLLAFALAASPKREQLWDDGWRFHRGDSTNTPGECTFPTDLSTTRCMGLERATAGDASTAACAQACCDAGESCQTWQWCGDFSKGTACGSFNHGLPSCWIGAQADCHEEKGWVSRARASSPPGPPECGSPFCKSGFDDSGWRAVEVPHDWSIETLPSREEDSSATAGLLGVPQAVPSHSIVEQSSRTTERPL